MINHPNRNKSANGIRRFDPAEGQAFQGDVAIIPMPADIAISRVDEVAPVKGRLILQEGDVSGHHHAINLKNRAGTARLFRDPVAVNAMVSRGILTRADLAIGCLVVEGSPVRLDHEEHDAIELPPGQYVIGCQIESAGAEERVVAD